MRKVRDHDTELKALREIGHAGGDNADATGAVLDVLAAWKRRTFGAYEAGDGGFT